MSDVPDFLNAPLEEDDPEAARVEQGIANAPVPENVKDYMRNAPGQREGQLPQDAVPPNFDGGIPPEDQTDEAAGAPNVRRPFENISYDPEAEARRAGYSWPEIQDHIATSTATALAAGYTGEEVDRFLGYSDPAVLANRTRLEWGNRLAEDPAALDSLGPEGLATLPEMRRNYADALLAKETKGPLDFAANMAGALTGAAADRRIPVDAQGVAEASDMLAANLPSREEVTDTAIAVGQASGAPVDNEMVRTAKANLLDYWSGLGGGSLMDAYRESNIDPLLQDALITPKPPGPDLPPPMDDTPFGSGDWREKDAERTDIAATLENLMRPGRDRINPVCSAILKTLGSLSPLRWRADMCSRPVPR